MNTYAAFGKSRSSRSGSSFYSPIVFVLTEFMNASHLALPQNEAKTLELSKLASFGRFKQRLSSTRFNLKPSTVLVESNLIRNLKSNSGYKVIYWVTEETKSVIIADVFDGRRNPNRITEFIEK